MKIPGSRLLIARFLKTACDMRCRAGSFCFFLLWRNCEIKLTTVLFSEGKVISPKIGQLSVYCEMCNCPEFVENPWINFAKSAMLLAKDLLHNTPVQSAQQDFKTCDSTGFDLAGLPWSSGKATRIISIHIYIYIHFNRSQGQAEKKSR